MYNSIHRFCTWPVFLTLFLKINHYFHVHSNEYIDISYCVWSIHVLTTPFSSKLVRITIVLTFSFQTILQKSITVSSVNGPVKLKNNVRIFQTVCIHKASVED